MSDQSFLTRILRSLLPPSQRYNLRTLRTSPSSEFSGSLGDLGTLLPLLIALTLSNSISLSTTFVFTGLSNILTGIFFSIPLPVQPMKAIAAVAISRNFSITETSSAGLFVGGCVFVLAVTGLLNWIARVIPIPIVKGIQVGAGLTLVIGAGEKMLRPLWWTYPWNDNIWWSILAFVGLLVTTKPVASPAKSKRAAKAPRIPFALIAFLVGLVISLILLYGNSETGVTPYYVFQGQHQFQSNALPQSQGSTKPRFFSIWKPRTYIPPGRAFRNGALDAGLGQLPLTTLNSIIAVVHLSAELFPSNPPIQLTVDAPPPSQGPPQLKTTPLALSIAMMNLISPWFGGMPACHGSGGLAGQYKFGARSGSSVIILGTIKLLLGFFVNETWLVEVLRNFPKAILGIMVLAAGVELCRVGESLNTISPSDITHQGREHGNGPNHIIEGEDDDDDGEERKPSAQERMDRWTVMMVTVAMLLAFKNDAVGFLAGLICHFSLKWRQYWGMWKDRRMWRGRSRDTGMFSRRGRGGENERIVLVDEDQQEHGNG